VSSTLARWEKAVTPSLIARDKQVTGVLTSIQKLYATTSEFLDDSYYDARSSSIKSAVILTQTEEALYQIVTEVIPSLKLVLGSTNDVLLSARNLTNSIERDASALGPEIAETTKTLNTLLQTLEIQIKDASPEVVKTATSISKTLTTLEALLDGDVRKTLSNVEKLSGQSAEIAETANIALKPLRSKTSLLRRLLTIGLGMIRIDIRP